MHCSKCGFENPDSARFCIECAAPFARKCPSCGAENPARAKFCAQCSTAIEPPKSASPSPLLPDHPAVRVVAEVDSAPADGERKTVTALFADIKGSMELMEDIDPEEARVPFLTRVGFSWHHWTRCLIAYALNQLSRRYSAIIN